MKTLIRLCLQLALVCYSGFVVAVEPLYVLGLKGTFVGDDLSGDLVLSKYDFAKNTWKDYIFDSQEVFLELAYICPIYVYGSRVYCLIKEIKNYTLYIFDRDLNLLTKKQIDIELVFKSGLYVDNQGIFVGAVNEGKPGQLFKYDLLGNFDKSLSLFDVGDSTVLVPMSFQKDNELLYVSGYLDIGGESFNLLGLKYIGVNPRSLQEKKSGQQKDAIQIDDGVLDLSICFIKGDYGYMLTAENRLAIVRLQDMVTINTVEISAPIIQVQVDGNKLLILSTEDELDGQSTLYEYSLSGEFLFSQELSSSELPLYTCFNIQKGKAYFVGFDISSTDTWFRLINQLSNNLQQSTLIGKQSTGNFIYYLITCASEDSPNLQNLQRFSPFSFQRGSGFGF